MKIYNVEIIENLSRVVEVEADNYDTAKDIVQKKYDNEEIVLDWNDCNDVEYKQYPASKIKDNINLSLEYNKEDKKIYIYSEDGSGCEYRCNNIDDLKNDINIYIDTYIEVENEKNYDEMER